MRTLPESVDERKAVPNKEVAHIVTVLAIQDAAGPWQIHAMLAQTDMCMRTAMGRLTSERARRIRERNHLRTT
jgi:hypothetical protein